MLGGTASGHGSGEKGGERNWIGEVKNPSLSLSVLCPATLSKSVLWYVCILYISHSAIWQGDNFLVLLSTCPCALNSHIILPRDLLIHARDLDGNLNNANISLIISMHHCKRSINIIILLHYYIKNMNQALPAWAGWENKTQRVVQRANGQFIIYISLCPYKWHHIHPNKPVFVFAVWYKKMRTWMYTAEM